MPSHVIASLLSCRFWQGVSSPNQADTDDGKGARCHDDDDGGGALHDHCHNHGGSECRQNVSRMLLSPTLQSTQQCSAINNVLQQCTTMHHNQHTCESIKIAAEAAPGPLRPIFDHHRTVSR